MPHRPLAQDLWYFDTQKYFISPAPWKRALWKSSVRLVVFSFHVSLVTCPHLSTAHFLSGLRVCNLIHKSKSIISTEKESNGFFRFIATCKSVIRNISILGTLNLPTTRFFQVFSTCIFELA